MEAFGNRFLMLQTTEETVGWIEFDFCQCGIAAQLIHGDANRFQRCSFLIRVIASWLDASTGFTTWSTGTIALTAFMTVTTTLLRSTALTATTATLGTTFAVTRTSTALERRIATNGRAAADFPGLLFFFHENPTQVGFEMRGKVREKLIQMPINRFPNGIIIASLQSVRGILTISTGQNFQIQTEKYGRCCQIADIFHRHAAIFNQRGKLFDVPAQAGLDLLPKITQVTKVVPLAIEEGHAVGPSLGAHGFARQGFAGLFIFEAGIEEVIQLQGTWFVIRLCRTNGSTLL
jgi:hypothetical protein